MSHRDLRRIQIEDYLASKKSLPVYKLIITPNFSPVDINVQFLIEEGWSHADRLRFHTEMEIKSEKAKHHPLTKIISSIRPHLLIRHYDREEDSFITLHVNLNGEIVVLSNDKDFAQRYVSGLFLECPPSFHSVDELQISEEWIDNSQICAMFLGMLSGALGWDPLKQIPPAIQTSLEEAEKALSIANYHSCVVMCRRTIEALLRFAFPRLLGRPAADNKGRSLTLDAMIQQFGKHRQSLIPNHLLHVLDSIRLIGNVPGAHAAEIKGYKFTKHDAEFILASVHYFIEQYFSKIDKEVLQYYTLTIDLNEK